MVRSIQEEFPGVSDDEVIQIALKYGLIILTFDGDYGEMIFKYAKSNAPSVIFFRDKKSDPEFAGKMLVNVITKTSISLKNAFTVIETNSIRQRFYTK